jgi:hypothetical protein
MKNYRRLTLAAAAVAMFCGAVIANASNSENPCRNCWTQYRACMANGGNNYVCYENYESCLYFAGCIVP